MSGRKLDGLDPIDRRLEDILIEYHDRPKEESWDDDEDNLWDPPATWERPVEPIEPKKIEPKKSVSRIDAEIARVQKKIRQVKYWLSDETSLPRLILSISPRQPACNARDIMCQFNRSLVHTIGDWSLKENGTLAGYELREQYEATRYNRGRTPRNY